MQMGLVSHLTVHLIAAAGYSWMNADYVMNQDAVCFGIDCAVELLT
jgi:hypothetical protein